MPNNEPYTHGALPMLRRVLKRQGKLFQRDPTLTRARIAQCIIVGLIIGGLWFDLEVSAEDARCGQRCRCHSIVLAPRHVICAALREDQQNRAAS